MVEENVRITLTVRCAAENSAEVRNLIRLKVADALRTISNPMREDVGITGFSSVHCID
jgi:hypothetical protein